MIAIKQGRIFRFTPTKIGINITIEILSEDLDREYRDLLETLWKDGTPIAGVLQEFQKEEEDDEPEGSKELLLLRLESLMRSSALRNGGSFDEDQNNLLQKYGVQSAKKLSILVIKNEIKEIKKLF